MELKRITTPLTDDVIEALRAGDKVLLSGVIYTARDTAHKRFIDALDAGKDLPIDIRGQVIYYCGPSPASPGRVIVKEAMKTYKAVYFGATGGAGALLSRPVVSYDIIAYEELGPEALARLTVRDLPLFVINDVLGNDLYEMGVAQYKRP
jgi:fumarate hydratase subunit beta